MEKVLQSSKHISVWQTSTMSTSAYFHASLRDRHYRHVTSFLQYSSCWYFTIVRQLSRALKCVYGVRQTTRIMVVAVTLLRTDLSHLTETRVSETERLRVNALQHFNKSHYEGTLCKFFSLISSEHVTT